MREIGIDLSGRFENYKTAQVLLREMVSETLSANHCFTELMFYTVELHGGPQKLSISV